MLVNNNLYGLQPYQFEPYTAENGSTDDSSDQDEMPVDCEHGSRLDCIEWWAFCCDGFLPFFFFFFCYSGKNILGHFKRHFVPQISS